MPTTTKQHVPLRIHPDTYADLSALASEYAISSTMLANHVLRDFIASGRELVLTRKSVTPQPAKPAPKPMADMSVWLDDDEPDV